VRIILKGLWKSPEGKIVLISDFRYEAKTTAL